MLRGPLENIVILDLTRALAGPFCSMVLGDLGADVIKIEMPGRGDDARSWGPPFIDGSGGAFIGFNRNKRSVTLDLHEAADRRTLLEMVRQADVLLENFSPGTMARFGLDEAALKQANPELIYCSISGYGQQGPLANYAAMDLVIQAMSGVMSLTGEPQGRPVKAAVPVADLFGGFTAALSILGALLSRERGYEPRNRLDVSMLDALVTMLGQAVVASRISGEAPRRFGNSHELIAPYTSFRTATQDVVISLVNQKHWQLICAAAPFAALADEPDYRTQADRNAHRARLCDALQTILLTRAARDWLDLLLPLGVPVAPVNSVPEILAHPHLKQRGTMIEVEYPAGSGRRVEIPGMPWRDVASGRPVRDPPALGQHNEEVLAQFGIAAVADD